MKPLSPLRRVMSFDCRLRSWKCCFNSQKRFQSSDSIIKLRKHGPSREPPSNPQGSPSVPPALSLLPPRLLIRSLMVMSLTSSPRLLDRCLPVINRLSSSSSLVLDPDKNPILRAVVRAMFYNQFCAGVNDTEVKKTITMIKSMGFKGVILGYAKDVVVDTKVSSSRVVPIVHEEDPASNRLIDAWRDGNLQSLRMIGAGDFLSIKFTGAGPAVTEALELSKSPPPKFWKAISEICETAASQKTRVWIDAEQQVFQHSIYSWTIKLMEKYNRDGEANVYTTFQAYLKATPDDIAKHLNLAQKQGWTLGIKLVRGAYIASEPRHLIHDTKRETDMAYNFIVERLLTRSFPGVIQGMSYPKVQLFVASHNIESVLRAYEIQRSRILSAQPTIPLEYGQLQGMADNVSCKLLQLGQHTAASTAGRESDRNQLISPKIFKCLCWGSTRECLQFLIRRAVENKGAIERTRGEAVELRRELWRRIKATVGLAKE
ncbi:MAG: hypothetical protein M1834_008414 [Cirrosporium novae-zelandiae]|nr:MAG: hypothetical protein M1834_008414 [Cirrosporium novae-zelandiae]